MTKNTKELGFLGENIAGRYLLSKSYNIVARNYSQPWGEIDIIAEKDGILFFVEVKTNSAHKINFSPELRVNKNKIAHISRVALSFLQKINSPDKEWQIDIISVVLEDITRKAKITHFKNVASNIY